ncbi:M23 family metallopeptidase, partial [Salmonella enterica subsp. enterica serovar Enteritidis]|uniref:M23 family metallopeptidase n=1 Tax=Salmonella enterica TaxID=28901 RepID=UPI0016543508
VILQHADNVYSAYAHLQPGKLRVRTGAKVKKGAVLGLCGNTGNSSEPHLHFQLQDGPRLESSWGIEPVFKDVAIVRDGKPMKVAEYTWLKGDLVGEPAAR